MLRVAAILAAAHFASVPAAVAEGPTDTATRHIRKLIYNNPMPEATAGVRENVTVRGAGQSAVPELFVLAPDHIGITTHEKPTLYWYQSDSVGTAVEIAINRDDQVDPVLETSADGTTQRGIHKFELAKHQIAIEKDVEYQWYVTMRSGSEERSEDILASGMIKRIDPPRAISQNLLSQNQEDLIYTFAEEGIWYDALECVSNLIEQNPENNTYRELRAELLDFGNLPEVAEYDRADAAGALVR